MDARLPLYQRVRDDILGHIARGEWRPDQPLPTEAWLSENYEVSMGTIRKAVNTLVQEQILYRMQGRGTFVRRPQFRDSLFRFFRQLDQDGETVVPDSRVLSCVLETPPAAAGKALAIEGQDGSIRLDRQRMLQEDNWVHEQIWLPAERFSSLLQMDVAALGNLLYPFYEQYFGEVVASARETLTIQLPDAALAAFLEVAADQPVVNIERVACSYGGRPIEYRISRGRADRFRYQIDIS